MSADTLLSDDGILEIEVVSPEEVRERARLPQTSGLSSLISKGLSRSTSLPGSASTPTSALCENRQGFTDALESRGVPFSIPEEAATSSPVEAPEELYASSRPILRRSKKRMEQDPATEVASELEDTGEFVPPHLMSMPAKLRTTSRSLQPGSLFEGVGRKLRGMDAVRFRRSVMQQTGFLETSAQNTVH